MIKAILLTLTFLFSFPAFAQTASKIPVTAIDNRQYAEQDIIVMQCSVQTGGLVTTCTRADGTSAASAGGTKILGLEAWHGDTTFIGFMCLHNHTGADIVDAAAGTSGTVGWLFGRDCTGTGTEWEKSLLELANYTNTGTSKRGLGIVEMSSINVTIPSGEKIAAKLTGHNSGLLVKLYVRDL
jgi:hypothetical protein